MSDWARCLRDHQPCGCVRASLRGACPCPAPTLCPWGGGPFRRVRRVPWRPSAAACDSWWAGWRCCCWYSPDSAPGVARSGREGLGCAAGERAASSPLQSPALSARVGRGARSWREEVVRRGRGAQRIKIDVGGRAVSQQVDERERRAEQQQQLTTKKEGETRNVLGAKGVGAVDSINTMRSTLDTSTHRHSFIKFSAAAPPAAAATTGSSASNEPP